MKGDIPLLSQFAKWSWAVLAISAIFQCVLYGTESNVFAVLISLVAWALFSFIFLRPSVVEGFPLSVFMIMGYVAAQFYVPMVATLIEGKPMVFNLLLPEQVFLHAFAALLVLIVTHHFYRAIFSSPPAAIQKFLLKVGLYTPPNDLQIWILGLLGLGGMAVVALSAGENEVDNDPGTVVKLMQGFMPFTYAPFFLMLGKLFGKTSTKTRYQAMYLVIFTIVLLVVSMARNSRGAFMVGVTSLVFAFGLGLLVGINKTRLLTFRNVLAVLILFWLVTGPLIDLGAAMVIVRGQRQEISRTELIRKTFEVFQDKETIRLFKKLASNKDITSDWDEFYLDNIFLARFCNIKFNDASLSLAEKISQFDRSLLEYSVDRIWATLPGPFLTVFGATVEKETVMSFSFGDYLFYTAGGRASILGSRITGHLAGTGMAAFGWWYLFLLAVLIIPVFFLFDLLSLRIWDRSRINHKISMISYRFSISGLLSLTVVWQFMNAESVIDFAAFILRGWIQLVVLYLVVFHITKVATNFLKP